MIYALSGDVRAAVLQQARRVVDERGGGSDEQEQEVEDPHGVLAMYNALALRRTHLLL